MDKRRFAIGFVIIFAILALYLWLEISANRGQREINLIYAENTTVALAGTQTQNAEMALSVTSTSTATGTPRREFATLTPSPTATISGTITGTLTLTPTLFPTIPITSGLFTATPTATILRTATATIATTPTAGPTSTDTPKPPEATATNTPFPQAFNINGRVTLDGDPIKDIVISLERDRGVTTDVLTTTLTAADGTFEFAEVFPSGLGFNIVFQNENQGFLDDEVMAWAWLGLIKYSGDDEVDLPDLEIGTGEFNFEEPVPGTDESIGDISSSSPLKFDWTHYKDDEEIEYWVDLLEDTTAQEPVWQSPFDTLSSADWDGITEAGTKVEPGDYLWGVGAQVPLDDEYTLTIFSWLAALELIE